MSVRPTVLGTESGNFVIYDNGNPTDGNCYAAVLRHMVKAMATNSPH